MNQIFRSPGLAVAGLAVLMACGTPTAKVSSPSRTAAAATTEIQRLRGQCGQLYAVASWAVLRNLSPFPDSGLCDRRSPSGHCLQFSDAGNVYEVKLAPKTGDIGYLHPILDGYKTQCARLNNMGAGAYGSCPSPDRVNSTAYFVSNMFEIVINVAVSRPPWTAGTAPTYFELAEKLRDLGHACDAAARS